MWTGIPDVFPFFGRKERPSVEAPAAGGRRSQPVLNVSLDHKVYRPGDAVTATVEICNGESSGTSDDLKEGILLEDLVVEVRGTEKLDPQWVVIPKQAAGAKQRRGERVFLVSSGHIMCNTFLQGGSTKSYLIRTTLPKILPPSYRGTAVRYFYHLTAKVKWNFITAENAGSNSKSSRRAAVPLEKRISLIVWTMPNCNGLTADELKEGYGAGIVPMSHIEVEMHWKENSDYFEWSRTAGDISSVEDDICSQGSESVAHSPIKGGLDHSFERLLLQSPSLTPRGNRKDPRSEVMNRMTPKKTTLLTASPSDTCLEKEQSSPFHAQNGVDRSSSENGTLWNRSVMDGYLSEQDEDSKLGSPLGYIRGKAYNIRIDDQILVRFSPKNPDSTYYFGDMVAGVVSFPDDRGLRKCLEVSAVLEVREILNPSNLHPSRKNSQVIAKVLSEYYEVVADMSQTHFIFSIPLDGPASFSTPHITVQWVLRFEFVTNTANVDWTEYEHPLQIKERDRGEWTMPITVHAPLPRTHGGVRKERPVSPLRDFWVQSPKASGWVESPRGSPAGPSNGHL